MPSINLDLDYFDHPKTGRLIGLLGRGAEVLPVRLWSFTGRHFPATGRLAAIATLEIETAVCWWGKPGAAVRALLECGFLEQEGDGTFVVHDWLEHSGHLAAFKERAKKAAQARWRRLAEEKSEMSHNDNSDASSMKNDASSIKKHASSNASSNACASRERKEDTLSGNKSSEGDEGCRGEGEISAQPLRAAALFSPAPESNLMCHNHELVVPARSDLDYYQRTVKPAHAKRPEAVESIIGCYRRGLTSVQLREGADRYAKSCIASNRAPQHRQSAATFYREGGAHEEFIGDRSAVEEACDERQPINGAGLERLSRVAAPEGKYAGRARQAGPLADGSCG